MPNVVTTTVIFTVDVFGQVWFGSSFSCLVCVSGGGQNGISDRAQLRVFAGADLVTELG